MIDPGAQPARPPERTRPYAGDLNALPASPFNHYGTRMLAGLAAALALVLGVLHLPLYPPARTVGWQAVHRAPAERIEALETAPQPDREEHAPITRFGAQEEPPPEADTPAEGRGTSRQPTPAPPPPPRDRPQRLSSREILEFADTMPEIVGGVGTYYLNIEYPQQAREAGIEGRLVLDFVVEQDGQVTQIQVLESLHPLCDSAAVRALRGTPFVPGRQNGTEARVRMRLPVRFKLVDRAYHR